jgi:hypothetical protein
MSYKSPFTLPPQAMCHDAKRAQVALSKNTNPSGLVPELEAALADQGRKKSQKSSASSSQAADILDDSMMIEEDDATTHTESSRAYAGWEINLHTNQPIILALHACEILTTGFSCYTYCYQLKSFPEMSSHYHVACDQKHHLLHFGASEVNISRISCSRKGKMGSNSPWVGLLMDMERRLRWSV